ncbi:hypothetical protein [Oryzihumus leptocrescens]|uniref:Uncharacterized protein n=1 Tax=Oryzihumus leptocrescens TaxID=297536 RepID=A0A542ZMC3_9MICO|nr:hypothetical protein [Oryzihumus leptocrescens]TQL61419.1 hypothetical protein FB474_2829 [Oryzihumus leptocrescens]
MPDNPHPPMDGQPGDLWLLDRLLAGEAVAASPALTALLASAASPGSPQELAGEAAAVAAFVKVGAGVSSARTRTRARRIPMFTTLLASKLAVATAAGGIAVAGTAAAAYTGFLPDGQQDLAHHSTAAPHPSSSVGSPQDRPASTPTHRATSTGTVGPDATGPAAFGLCTAHQHGGLAPTSVAYRSLAKAAGGTSRIGAYCASVTHPGHATTGHPSGAPAGHPTGDPTSRSTGAPTGHPSGAHTGRPSGAGTTHPAYSTARK